MLLLAIDPGPLYTAYVVYNTATRRPVCGDKVLNSEMWKVFEDFWSGPEAKREVAIEMIASYGMAVGAETFETCIWIGRFMQHWWSAGIPIKLVYRREVKMHLCGSSAAKDPNVRAAIIDLYGGSDKVAKGTKKAPGPLYGFAADMFAALGVALATRHGGCGTVIDMGQPKLFEVETAPPKKKPEKQEVKEVSTLQSTMKEAAAKLRKG